MPLQWARSGEAMTARLPRNTEAVAFSTASTQATPDSRAVTAEFLATAVVEPPPAESRLLYSTKDGLQCSCVSRFGSAR